MQALPTASYSGAVGGRPPSMPLGTKPAASAHTVRNRPVGGLRQPTPSSPSPMMVLANTSAILLKEIDHKSPAMQDAMHIPGIHALFPGMPAFQGATTPARTTNPSTTNPSTTNQFPFSLDTIFAPPRPTPTLPPRPTPTPKKTTLLSNTNNVPRHAIRAPVTVPTGREDLRPSKPRIDPAQLQEIKEYLSKEVKEQVAQELKEPLKEVKEQVRQEVKEQINQEVKEQVGEEVKEQIKQEVKDQVSKEVKEQLRQEVKERLEEVKEQLRQEVKEQLRQEVKEQLRQEVKEQLSQEVKEQVSQEIKEQVSHDLKEQLSQQKGRQERNDQRNVFFRNTDINPSTQKRKKEDAIWFICSTK
jgi:DNA polymerase III gamma/tau subunit